MSACDRAGHLRRTVRISYIRVSDRPEQLNVSVRILYIICCMLQGSTMER